MADSDNSTSLPPVICGSVLAPTAIAMAGSQPKAVADNVFERDQSTDPAWVAWRKWQAAHEETERPRAAAFGEELTETVGFPKVMIELSDGKTVTLRSLDTLRGMLRDGSVDLAVGAKAEADLQAHQARWDASDRVIGYSAALRAESGAADRAERLLGTLTETPAISLAGVAAKLDAILREGQPSKDDDEFPWPQIRSVSDDIGRISEHPERS